MTKKVKRAISLFLAALMLLSTMAVVAFADNNYTAATSKEIGPHDCVIRDYKAGKTLFEQYNITFENKVEPTCSKWGSVDVVMHCTICGKALKTYTLAGNMDEGERDRYATELAGVIDFATEAPYTYVKKEVVKEFDKYVLKEQTVTKAEGRLNGISYKYTNRYNEVATKAISLKKLPCEASKTPVIKNVKAPTCTKAGSYTEFYYCVKCDQPCYFVDVVVKKDEGAHNPDVARMENIIEATCKEEGSYDSVIRCKDCGKILSKTFKVVPKLTTHKSSLNSTAFVDAKDKYTRTCADGEDRCVICGELLQPAIPHLYDKGVIVNTKNDLVTYTEGYNQIVYTCIICGHRRSEILDTYNKNKLGDVNLDNHITSADARYILRAAVGLANFDKVIDMTAGCVSFKLADMDKNGKVEAADARLALRTAVGLEKVALVK